MSTFTRTFHDGTSVRSYEVDGISPAEMARAALAYCNVQPGNYASFEEYGAAMEDANTFATFCVGETLEDETCNPLRSFRDLWAEYLRRQHGAA